VAKKKKSLSESEEIFWCNANRAAAAGADVPRQPAAVRAARGAQGARGRRVQYARVRVAGQAQQPRAAVLERLRPRRRFPPAVASASGRRRHPGVRSAGGGTGVQAGDGRGAQALRAHGHARRVLG